MSAKEYFECETLMSVMMVAVLLVMLLSRFRIFSVFSIVTKVTGTYVVPLPGFVNRQFAFGGCGHAVGLGAGRCHGFVDAFGFQRRVVVDRVPTPRSSYQQSVTDRCALDSDRTDTGTRVCNPTPAKAAAPCGVATVQTVALFQSAKSRDPKFVI